MLNRYAFMGMIAAGLFVACGPRQIKNTDAAQTDELPRLTNFSAGSERLTIMTWNMENLFDTVDNPDTNDDAFLPLAVKKTIPGFEDNCKKADAMSWINECLSWDWTDDVLNLKEDRLGQVIRSVNGGRGPDILIVEEIENLFVLEKLINEHLPNMGYKAYLIENHDARGIDVGMITRLTPTVAPALQSLRSRPGLVTQFDLGGGQKLNVIGVHFPISPTPVEKRLRMFQKLSEMRDEHPGEFTLAAGDFNFPHGLQERYDLINSYAKPEWIVSHLYCGDCQGTFYDSYEDAWSQLDFILLSKNFMNADTAWTLDPASVHVHHPFDFQNTYDGHPAGFSLPNKRGVSDHWPLVIQLVKTDKAL